jgi:putative two-component system response regulator
MASTIALNHHEKYDGSGYPNGIAGKDIPISARIVAISDVFDALTSERPYKQAWPIARAVVEIRKCAHTHFDPELVSAFEESLPAILEVRAQYQEKAQDFQKNTFKEFLQN